MIHFMTDSVSLVLELNGLNGSYNLIYPSLLCLPLLHICLHQHLPTTTTPFSARRRHPHPVSTFNPSPPSPLATVATSHPADLTATVATSHPAKLDDKWIADSDVITQTVEQKYPDPSLVTPPEKASMARLSMVKMYLLLTCHLVRSCTIWRLLWVIIRTKKWSVPDSLPHLKTYMKTLFSLDSSVKTTPLTEDIIEGWRPKVEG